jgi:hypothetical protein
MGSTVGNWIHQNNIPVQKFALYQMKNSWSLNFYGQSIFPPNDSLNAFTTGDYILTTVENLHKFDSTGKKYDIAFTGESYPVSGLKLKFINPHTRETMTQKYVVIKLK